MALKEHIDKIRKLVNIFHQNQEETDNAFRELKNALNRIEFLEYSLEELDELSELLMTKLAMVTSRETESLGTYKDILQRAKEKVDKMKTVRASMATVTENSRDTDSRLFSDNRAPVVQPSDAFDMSK